MAALVVGRLASESRARADEAESRLRLAEVREREAALVARVASAVMGGARIDEELPRIASDGEIRVSMSPVPSHSKDEHAVRLQSGGGSGWLYVRRGIGWEREDVERLARTLGKLMEVAHERERVAIQSAETEATRRADLAKTAVLHAVSHDFRSPLTAITTAAGGAAGGRPLRGRPRGPAVGDRGRVRCAWPGWWATCSTSRRSRRARCTRAPTGATCSDVVSGAAEQVRAARGEHPVLIELPADLPLVQADAAQLERVFSNLIENAINHSPDGVPVRISGGSGGGRVTVRVVDRGPRHPVEPAGARVRAVLPRARSRPRAPAWGWRSAAASWRPTAGGIQLQRVRRHLVRGRRSRSAPAAGAARVT